MKQKVFVFGSYVTDLCARADAFPRPGQTVQGSSFSLGPGGKGSNQAVAAKRAGADVLFATKLGDDELGRQALAFYQAEGMDCQTICIDKTEQTGAALILVEEGSAQNQIVVVGGACTHFTQEDLPNVLALLAQSDWLLLQLETNLEPVCALLKQARALGVNTILNPAPAKPLEEGLLRCVDIITPNESEAEALTGITVADESGAREAAKQLHGRGVSKVIITLGGRGCFASDGTHGALFPVVDCGPVVDTTGAGDAFSGGLAAGLARGMGFFDAVVYASCTAGLAVTRRGTAPGMPHQEEIDKVFQKQNKK